MRDHIEIKTKHLFMRHLKQDDLDYLTELNSDPDVRKFFPDFIQDREQTKTRLNQLISYFTEKNLPSFIIFSVDTHEFMGRCGFGSIETGEIEVGYLLHKKFWGQGFASEALTALLAWAKENIDAEYIIAFAPVDHIASQRVMQKCGMKFYKNDIGHGVQCCFYRINNSK